MHDTFISLSCANCGGKLEIYEEMERFACRYCRSELLVQRRGGTVALKAVTEAIKQVQVGTDKTAAELAIIRLEREAVELSDRFAQLSRTHTGSRLGVRLLVMTGLLSAGALISVASLIGVMSSSGNPGVAIAISTALGVVFLGLAVWIPFVRMSKDQKSSLYLLRNDLEARFLAVQNELSQNRALVTSAASIRRCAACRREIDQLSRHCSKCGRKVET